LPKELVHALHQRKKPELFQEPTNRLILFFPKIYESENGRKYDGYFFSLKQNKTDAFTGKQLRRYYGIIYPEKLRIKKNATRFNGNYFYQTVQDSISDRVVHLKQSLHPMFISFFASAAILPVIAVSVDSAPCFVSFK